MFLDPRCREDSWRLVRRPIESGPAVIDNVRIAARTQEVVNLYDLLNTGGNPLGTGPVLNWRRLTAITLLPSVHISQADFCQPLPSVVIQGTIHGKLHRGSTNMQSAYYFCFSPQMALICNILDNTFRRSRSLRRRGVFLVAVSRWEFAGLQRPRYGRLRCLRV